MMRHKALLFALAVIVALSCVAQAHWNEGDSCKWVQRPDLDPTGIDINASSGTPLADDFLCTEPGRLTNIDVWGSWLNDHIPYYEDPTAVKFTLSIHADIPTNDPDKDGLSNSHALGIIGKKATTPPLGIITVAAMLPTGWRKRLVDCNVRDLTNADLDWADVVLVSAMVIQKQNAKRVIARAKAADLRVIAGGPLFTIEPDEFPLADHLILGEAETVLPRFLADLADGRPARVYKSAERPDLTQTLTPLWELVDDEAYTSRCIQFSRGCPNSCDFCSVTQLFGREWRTKQVSQVIAELDYLYDLKWSGSVSFVDDNLTGKRRTLKDQLLPALIAWQKNKQGITFSCQATVNLADDEELMAMMVAAGFGVVFVGIETVDDAGLNECSKHTNIGRNLLEDVRAIQRAGLQVQAGFIVGFDHDTPSVFRRMGDFIKKSGIATAMVGILQAPTGTRLFDRLNSQNRISGRMSGDNVAGSTNIVPVMKLSTLQNGYRRLLRDIYSPAEYYQTLRTFLREYSPPRATKARLRLWHLRALFRSVVHLGIIGREGSRYLHLLWWTLVRKPRALPLAVTLSITGHHFRRHADLLPEAKI